MSEVSFDDDIELSGSDSDDEVEEGLSKKDPDVIDFGQSSDEEVYTKQVPPLGDSPPHAKINHLSDDGYCDEELKAYDSGLHLDSRNVF